MCVSSASRAVSRARKKKNKYRNDKRRGEERHGGAPHLSMSTFKSFSHQMTGPLYAAAAAAARLPIVRHYRYTGEHTIRNRKRKKKKKKMINK